MIEWAGVLSAVLKLVVWFTQYLHDQKLIDQALASAALKSLREADNAIAKAKAARTVQHDANSKSDPRLQHDKYERADGDE